MEKNTILLDVDGVIFDSNSTKEQNIIEAAGAYVLAEKAHQFGQYFTELNGVPRETKIYQYFGSNSLADKILKRYNQLNQNRLKSIKFTSEADEVIKNLAQRHELIALSGASELELHHLFELNKINHYFKAIYGGPTTKMAHLEKIDTARVIFFTGDSKSDHQVAVKNNLTFVFMTGYTQFHSWKDYFNDFPTVKIIKNLKGLETIISSNHQNLAHDASA